MYDPEKKPGLLDKFGAWAEGESARDISHVRQNTQLMDRVVRDAEFSIKAKAMSDAATDVAMLGQIATELHKGGAKLDQWKRWVTAGYGKADEAAKEAISGLRGEFRGLIESGKVGTLVKGGNKIEEWVKPGGVLDAWETRIRRISEHDPNAGARIFVELDQMKRALGANSKAGKYLGDDAAAFFRERYKALAATLEDEARWGAEAAGYQKQLNRVYHDWLNGEGTFNKHFMGQGIDTAAFSDWNKNPLGLQKSAADYLNLMGKAGSEQEQALVITQLQRDRKFAQFMLDKYELPPEQRSALQKALSGTYRVEKALAEGKDFMRIYRAAEALTGGRRRWIEFPILGAMAGGLPGALAGQVAMFAMNPGEQMRFWALARRLKEGTLSGMVRATERFGGATIPKLKGVGGVDDTLSAASRAGRAGKATLFEQLSDKGESEEDSYRRITNAYRDAAADPGKIEGNLQQTMPEWARMQPDLIKEMAGVEQRKAQAIAAALPPGQDMIDKMLGIEPMPVSYGQIDDAARLIEAANDPLSALEKMGNGSLTPAEVDIIEQVYPRMIQEMRMTVIEASQQGELEWSQKIQMGILLKVPTDISLKPEFIAAMQAAAQSQGGEEQPGMGGKKPGINPVGVTREYGKMLRPTSEQLEARASEER